MATVLISLAGAAAIFALALGWGTRRLTPEKMRGGAGAEAFGVFTELYDPGNHRAALEREAQKERVAVTPSPDDDDRPVKVDLDSGSAVVRRPR